MFNLTNNKIIKVGVSVSIDNRMEVAVVDYDTQTVTQYEQVEVGYNFQTKELADYLQFASTLRNVLDEMKLNVKDVLLNITIPSIHLSTAQIQANYEDAEIKQILSSYAQDSYLFKRHEPEIAYKLYPASGNGEVPVVYTAIQESVVENIKDALLSVGIDRFSVNNPYASVINGLVYLGKLDRQINSGEIWNFVQITNNGFTLFSMQGTTIREINDMPLPLKTFSPEEVYESMALSLQNNLSIYPASSLFVLSRSDLLSAQQLLQRMELRGNVDYLENNTYITEPFISIGEKIDSDFAKLISIECIGSAVTTSNSPLILCYMKPKDMEDEVYGTWNICGKEIIIDDTILNYIFLGIVIAVAVLGGILYFSLNLINGHFEGKINKLQEQKRSIEQDITKAKGESEGNVDTIILDISKNNKNGIIYFNSIAREIPDNIWLTYYYSDDQGELSIKGDTTRVESLYDFFNGIKNSVEGSRINLSKLEYNDIDSLLAPSGGNRTLNFEISGGLNNNKPNKNDEESNEEDSNSKTDKDNQGSSLPKEKSNDNNNKSEDEGLPEPPQFDPPATN